QPPLFLFLGPARSDAGDRQPHRMDAYGDAGAAPGELLVEHELGQKVEALASVLLRQESGRAQAKLVRLLDDLVRELLGLIVMGRHRTDLVEREVVSQIANRRLLGSEREIKRHLPHPSAS